jgi:hypothetical protein
MSPPIRDGSGNSIGSIRLGDGSEISEVRTGAGDVLFSAIPDSGLFRLTLDESSPTDLWNDNDFSISGGVTTDVSGANQTYDTGRAYSYDGSDGKISLGEAPDLSNGWSFGFWVYLDSSISTDAGIFEGIWGSGDANDYIRFVYDGSNVDLSVRGADTTDSQITITDSSPTLDGWSHYIPVGFDNGDIYLYKNSSEVGSDTSTFTDQSEYTATADGDIQVGYGRSGVFINYASQDVDDVRGYTKGLSSTEASDLYNNGSI